MSQFMQSIESAEPVTRWGQFIPLTDLPASLSQAIDRIRDLSKLPDNWDGYGSPGLTEPAKRKSMETLSFLRSYAIPSMQIDLVPGGGLQFEWTIGPRTLEVEILPDGTVEFLVAVGDAMMEGPVFDQSMLTELLRWLMRC